MIIWIVRIDLETQLSNKKDFYSLLLDEDITDDQYKHAQKVWDPFNIKN